MGKSSKLLFYAVCILLFSTSPQAFAETIGFSVTHGAATSTPSGYTKNVVSTPPSKVEDEDWIADYEPQRLVLVSVGDVLAPVEIEPARVILVNHDRGRFSFSKDQVQAITRTSVADFEHDSSASFNFRPTLFISICGFQVEATLDGDGNCSWQFEMESQLHDVLADYQYKHFAVDWDTHATNRTQVRDLADVVKGFLKTRVDDWDVVLVGHSRGGIFSHDLTRELVGHNKIKKLHTFLLDPTASVVLHDFYPSYKHEASPTVHFGSLYYDNDEFIDGVTEVGTIGDRNISGYNNYGRNNHYFNSQHATFAYDWLIRSSFGFEQALVDIKTNKDSGTFYADGVSGMEIVKISRPSGIHFDGDIEFLNGNVRIWGELSVGDLPAASISLDTTVGEDGVQFASATGAATSQLIIRNDLIQVSQNSLVGGYTATLDDAGLSATVSISHVSGNISIDSKEVRVTIDLGPISGSASGGSGNVIFPTVCFGFC